MTKEQRAQRKAFAALCSHAGISMQHINYGLLNLENGTPIDQTVYLKCLTKREIAYIQRMKERLHQESEILIHLGQRIRKSCYEA